MHLSKKTQPVSIRIPERTKRLIEEEADKNVRTFQDEALVLITEALHHRKYNVNDYV